MEMNHVLIVEDDKEIREGVEIYLKSQGYQVFQAADGVEGLKIIEKEEIHLAIVDVMMPRMDGIQMTIKLREKYDFPVIFLSAKSEEVDKIMGLNMGADDYVTKPFTPDGTAGKGQFPTEALPQVCREAEPEGSLLKRLYYRGP